MVIVRHQTKPDDCFIGLDFFHYFCNNVGFNEHSDSAQLLLAVRDWFGGLLDARNSRQHSERQQNY